MERPDLNGLIAAIVTPMRSDLSIDEESLRRYVDWLVGQGLRGLAVNVDTGEGPHLFPEERLRVLEVVAEEFSLRCRRGDEPAIGEYLARYPQWADQLRELATAVAERRRDPYSVVDEIMERLGLVSSP